MLYEGIISPVSRQLQYERRVLLIRGYGEEEAIPVADPSTPVAVPHDLSHSLRARVVLRLVSYFSRQLLLTWREAVCIGQPCSVAGDGNTELTEALTAVPECVAQLLCIVYDLCRCCVAVVSMARPCCLRNGT